MDSSRHHNPYAPEGANAMTEFPAARWSRAGATEDEIAVLRVEHDALPVAEQAGIVGWIGSVSDDDLAAILVDRRENVGFDEPVQTDEQPPEKPKAKHAHADADGEVESKP